MEKVPGCEEDTARTKKMLVPVVTINEFQINLMYKTKIRRKEFRCTFQLVLRNMRSRQEVNRSLSVCCDPHRDVRLGSHAAMLRTTFTRLKNEWEVVHDSLELA